MRYIRNEVLGELADALRRRIGHSMRPPFIAWATRHGVIEAARCEPYTLPGTDDFSRPLTVRVSINTPYMDRLEAVARKAGLISTPPPPRSRYQWAPCFPSSGLLRPSGHWHLELSMLPHEALDFVPYLAGLVVAHEEGDASLVPKLPLPTRLWQPTPLELKYAWSEAGWAVIEAYDRRRQALVRGGREAPLQQRA